MITDPLTTTLLDLHAAVHEPGFKLILGGGYGLYLRQIHLQEEESVRTLLPGDLWPFPRATEDIDLFLPTEIVVSLPAMQAIRTALDTLGLVRWRKFGSCTLPNHGTASAT